jgi:F0F1-type ATP synthase assembly protein I
MQFLVKALISLAVILAAVAIGRKIPSASGLIGVMPLTGALTLAWVFQENNGDQKVMEGFARGALWGILPSILFFLAALFCLKKGMPLPAVLGWGFGAWLAGALVHHWLVK